MIIREYYTTRSDGIKLVRSYSNRGMCIERDGVLYDEAIDPADSGREYIETNVPVFTDEKLEFEENPIAYIDKRIGQAMAAII